MKSVVSEWKQYGRDNNIHQIECYYGYDCNTEHCKEAYLWGECLGYRDAHDTDSSCYCDYPANKLAFFDMNARLHDYSVFSRSVTEIEFSVMDWRIITRDFHIKMFMKVCPVENFVWDNTGARPGSQAMDFIFVGNINAKERYLVERDVPVTSCFLK